MNLCKTLPIKRISKTFAYLIMKNIWIEKIAELLSHSILSLELVLTGTRFLTLSTKHKGMHNGAAITQINRLNFPIFFTWMSQRESGIFYFYFIFDDIHVSKQNSPGRDAAYCGVTSGAISLVLSMSNKKDTRLISVNNLLLLSLSNFEF